jgi:hypothetical protein
MRGMRGMSGFVPKSLWHTDNTRVVLGAYRLDDDQIHAGADREEVLDKALQVQEDEINLALPSRQILHRRDYQLTCLRARNTKRSEWEWEEQHKTRRSAAIEPQNSGSRTKGKSKNGSHSPCQVTRYGPTQPQHLLRTLTEHPGLVAAGSGCVACSTRTA